MMTSLTLAVGLLAAALTLESSVARAGVPPADTCTDAKAKATGAKVLGLAKAFGKNLKTPNTAKFLADISKAQSKFTKGFTKAEFAASGSPKGCATTDDAAIIEAKCDALVLDVLSDIVTCGNGNLDPGEECDGANPGICPGGAGCFPPGATDVLSGAPIQCQCSPASCANIDAEGADANDSGTFTSTSTGAPSSGDLYCGGLAGNPAMAFQPCVNDLSCGGGSPAGTCAAIPFLGVASFAPFPIAFVSYTFTAGPPNSKCEHEATIACGPAAAPCPGTPNLGAGSPCCSAPGYAVYTFFIPALGFCSRADQTACGGGVVDTSVPMLGDNDVFKVADTTAPTGPGCSYVGTESHGVCNTAPCTGQSCDALGQIVTTIGDGAFDAPGGHARFTIPLRSTTWLENSAPPCDPADIFDGADLLVTVFNLQLAPSTASATAGFVDSGDDADALSFCGAGPAAFGAPGFGNPDDGSATGTVSAAVGAAFSAGGPLYDLLFSALTPLTSPVLGAAVPACTPAPPGCPE
jgi:hypothetical protein